MTHLRIDNLHVAFGSVIVLNGLTLEVPNGECHALIGPNGAGKTTLLNVISGWIMPQGGSVQIQDQSLIGQAPDQIAKLGVVRTNQIPHGFPTLTVLDHLRAAFQQGHGWFKFQSEIDSKIETLVQQLNLDEMLAEPAQQLSHGQRKRLELGCALALDPSLLLLDEPSAGLSSGERAGMVEMLKGIPITMLIVEHDMDVVAALADRVSVLHCGRLLAQGTVEQIANNISVQEAYLGHVTS
jgi:branched-chain amino acid transport system ATP-binding protein